MINKCTFIGNLGKDPNYKVLESGHKVASFSIACSRKVKTRKMERQRNIRNGFPLWPGTIWPKSSASWPAKVRRCMWKESSAHEATRQKEQEKNAMCPRYGHEIFVCSGGRQNHRLLRFLLRPTTSAHSQHRLPPPHRPSLFKRHHSSLRRERLT